MIRVRCDKCDGVIEADDRRAGDKVACPACGDINRMPATGNAAASGPAAAKPAASDRAAAAGLPPDSGPEQRVLTVHPAMLRARPLTFLGLVLLFLAGAGAGVASMTGFGLVVGVPGAIAALVALAWLGVWKIRSIDEALEITNKRTVARRGLLSKHTTEVLHDNLRNVQVTQTFWNRVWNVGKIGLSSSAQDGIEIEMANIPKPEHVRRTIDLYRPL